MCDFLFKLKDKHPYSIKNTNGPMDVFDIIMDFLIPNGFEPSDALKEEYRNSKLNRRLNKLKSRFKLNRLFQFKRISK